jgi:hypothetical protein
MIDVFTWLIFIGHCDVVHAVETLNGGKSDSSVFYIPAVPLTIKKCVIHCSFRDNDFNPR